MFLTLSVPSFSQVGPSSEASANLSMPGEGHRQTLQQKRKQASDPEGKGTSTRGRQMGGGTGGATAPPSLPPLLLITWGMNRQKPWASPAQAP
jgi:hypothetical protein